MRTATPHRALRVLRGFGALVVLVVIVVGVPVFALALQRSTGLDVVPRSAPSLQGMGHALTRRDNGQLVAVVLVAGVWICWALFTISLVPEVVALVGRRPAPSLPGLGGFQRSAGALVAAIAIGFSIAPVVGGIGTAAHADVAPTPLTRIASASSQAPPAAPATSSPHLQSGRGVPAEATAPASAPTYEVQRRDTLWGIAERYLHEPLRYPEIAHLNPTLIGPDHEITPGTVLTLPSDATGPGLHRARALGTSTEKVTVRVEAGDTLEHIAQRVSGDGRDWPRAFAANQGRVEPGDEHFTDPNLIKPGWTLDIPVARTPAAPPAHGRAQPHSHTPPPTTPKSGNTAPPHTGHTPPPVPTVPEPTQHPDTPPTRTAQSPTPTTRPAQISRRSSQDAIVAFAGGGTLLAGVSLSALVMYRRRQFQRRRPGRVIGSSPPALIETERAVLTAGTPGLINVTWLDRAVRSLVQSCIDLPSARLPDVVAVRITDDDLTLVLSNPAPAAPAPWTANENSTRWSIRRGDPLPYDPARRESYFAPYPTLASIGYTELGEHWMLDLERVASLSLSGDAERCLNLTRFLAAELAHNTWSEMLRVTLVGFGQELIAANPDRLAYTADLTAAATNADANLKLVEDAMRSVGADVLEGRLHDIVGDQWAPHVLLVAPDAARDAAALDELLTAIKRQQARAAVALVLVDESADAAKTAWHMTVDRDGTLRVPALDLTLSAQQLPANEAAPLAQMLAFAAACEDEPIPLAHGDQPWDRYADACGGLILSSDQGAPIDEAPSPHGDDAIAVPVLHLAEAAPSRADSILSLSPQTYLDRAATTREDMQSLAPVVDTEIRNEVEQADPGLDRDYADWLDQDCPRPKVRLLGKPHVWAQGSLPDTPQTAFHTEAVALLSTRARGLLSSEYAGLMWPNEPDVVGKPKVRKSIANLRTWLGRDDAAGEEYLKTAFEGRVARYLLPDVLRDAELFRRLRVRGVARGADGLDDLWRALALVDGPPFDQIPIRDEAETARGPGGWLWLTDTNQRLDFEYQAMIVDTAHLVADRHLGVGEPEMATKAAQVSLRAGAYDDVPLLDLIAACLAQEHEAEAEAYVRQLLSNSGVEREEDLQPRTAEVLFRMRRRWRDQAS